MKPYWQISISTLGVLLVCSSSRIHQRARNEPRDLHPEVKRAELGPSLRIGHPSRHFTDSTDYSDELTAPPFDPNVNHEVNSIPRWIDPDAGGGPIYVRGQSVYLIELDSNIAKTLPIAEMSGDALRGMVLTAHARFDQRAFDEFTTLLILHGKGGVLASIPDLVLSDYNKLLFKDLHCVDLLTSE